MTPTREGWIACAVGALGVSSVMAQVTLMRELLGVFHGQELVLGVILGNWLLLTGVGAWLGRIADRITNPNTTRLVVVGQILVGVLPLAQVFAVRWLRNAVFTRGAEAGVIETVVSTFVLLLPYCLISGAMLSVACSALARGLSEPDQGGAPSTATGGTTLGAVYLADSVGSILGGVVLCFILIRLFDHFTLMCFPAFLNLICAGAVAARFGHRFLLGVSAVAGAGLAALMGQVNVDSVSTALQHQGQRVVFRGSSPYGRLVVTESAGQFDFIENGLPVISTHQIEAVEEAVHYAMAQRPTARRVLLVGGGVSGTTREVLKYPVESVTYVELDPLILEAGRRFLPESLNHPRVRVVTTDGRLFVRQTRERFDVVILDVPDPSTAQLNRLLTVEHFKEVRRVLSADGVLSFAVGRYENFVSRELGSMLSCACRTARAAFSHVAVVPGGRVFFLASDAPLSLDIADRLAQHGIRTELVNQHYLAAMLAPDRLADMDRALEQPAALNRDLSPILYFYHLLHWMSQYRVRFGLVECALIGALGVYVWRLRRVPRVLLASGFAASSLEVVLLLALQVLCGSIYERMGLVITLFMAGLTLGAWWAQRVSRAASVSALGALLGACALALAGYAALTPLGLGALVRLSQFVPGLASATGHVGIGSLTLLLGALVGAQFPLSGRLEAASPARSAGRLYAADLVGASLGALLASTLLIPVAGVTATCLVTAALNAATGLALMSGAGKTSVMGKG